METRLITRRVFSEVFAAFADTTSHKSVHFDTYSEFILKRLERVYHSSLFWKMSHTVHLYWIDPKTFSLVVAADDKKE